MTASSTAGDVCPGVSRFRFKRFIAFVALLAVNLHAPGSHAASRREAEPEWKEVKGAHFIVMYARDAAFAREVLLAAERLYKTISSRLGFTRYGDYWLWDNRVRIRLYPGHSDFVEMENAPGWAAGKAALRDMEISGVEGDLSFCSSVLPHEMTHLVFREFTGFGSSVPLWLDEGVAQLQEAEQVSDKMLIREASVKGRLLSLDRLARTGPGDLDGTSAALFYAQSRSVVSFLIDRYGSVSFRKFCGALKDGKSLEDALRFTYPQSARSIKQLEESWLQKLEDDSK